MPVTPTSPSRDATPDEMFVERDFRASSTLRWALRHAREFGRPVVLTHTDAEHLHAELAQLRAAVVALALLSAEAPQFDNPLHAFEAQALRDRVLADVPFFLSRHAHA